VTALIASILVVVVMTGIIVWYGGRRAPGTPLTWGEAFVGALFVFALMLFAYAIVPSQWLNYAGGPLRWRSDKIGIPTGPLHYIPSWPESHAVPAHKVHFLWMTFHSHPAGHGKVLFFIPTDNGLLFPKGITFFGRGKVVVTAQVLQDTVATLIYVVMIGGQLFMWSWWQKRGATKPAPPELTSAYGRPLVRKA
jgi:hypothetical protein